MKKANQDIRETLKKNGVKIWELADKVGLSPNYFGTKLRYELSSEEKTQILAYIKEIMIEKEVES